MKTVYEQLNKKNLQWGRIDEKTLYIWVPGYKTGDCYALEKFLMSHGAMVLYMKFDRQCGQTELTVIEPRNKVA